MQEHLLVTQDVAEVARMEKAIEICKKTLIDHGFAEFTFEDFLAVSDTTFLALVDTRLSKLLLLET